MLGSPFRFLAGLGRAVRVAGCGNADRPAAIDILLAFHHQDRAPRGDRFVDLIFAIEHAGVGATGAPFPIAATVAVTDPKPRLVAFRIANLLKSRIVIGRGKLAACAIALAIALLRSRPSAMVAVPRRAVGIDLDAEHLERLVCLRALGRASRTRLAVLAGLVIREPDAVALEQLLRDQSQFGLPHKRS